MLKNQKKDSHHSLKIKCIKNVLQKRETYVIGH